MEELGRHHHRHHHHHHGMTVGQWAALLMLCIIPLVGMVVLIVNIAIKKEGTRRNFSIAALLIRITIDIILALMYFNGLVPHFDLYI
ncbi:MAG: hypothetical protein MJZ96_07445 [Paludibacteraceae bacterium]|nr:hypothetical protein [Paludibacteraceae bacterium]